MRMLKIPYIVTLIKCIFLSLFFAPHSAWSLGLGDIRHSSYLGQPLDANIEILNIKNHRPEDLRLSQLSSEEAQKLGVDILYFPGNLQFELIESAGKVTHVNIRSFKPIVEPYINLVVKLQWPTGSVFREYALLLDMPLNTLNKGNQTPSEKFSDTLPSTPITTKAVPAPSPSNAHNEKTSLFEFEYTVRPGDSLSKIASNVSHPDIANEKMVDAIFTHNPHAFIDGNINLLKSGARLSIPAQVSVEVSELSHEHIDLANQNSQEVVDVVRAKKEGRLSLSVPIAHSPEVSSAEYSQYLRSQIDSAKEAMDQLEKENDDLRQHIQKLETSEYWKTMAEILTLQQERIEDLQVALDKKSRTIVHTNTPALIDPLEQREPNAQSFALNLESEKFSLASLGASSQDASPWVNMVASTLMFIVFLVSYFCLRTLSKSVTPAENEHVDPLDPLVEPVIDIPKRVRLGLPRSLCEKLMKDPNSNEIKEMLRSPAEPIPITKHIKARIPDHELKQRVQKKVQHYNSTCSNVNPMELTELTSEDEAVNVLLSIADQYRTAGKYAEAIAILSAQQHIISDPRIEQALRIMTEQARCV